MGKQAALRILITFMLDYKQNQWDLGSNLEACTLYKQDINVAPEWAAAPFAYVVLCF